MILLAITIIGCAAYGFLMRFYYRHWKALTDFRNEGPFPLTRISVIIAARNEEHTIWPLLVRLSQQTYPKEYFEIIVVDDYSTDATAEKVKQFPFSNLVLIQPDVPESVSSKKKAIETGIRVATGELIVTTDADCLPGQHWLETLAAFYAVEDPAFIAAPVMLRADERWLSIFQVLDFVTLQGITGASVAASFHSMCNGANLAYKKTAFESVNGFENIDRVASGDDMLLMFKIQQRFPGKVRYLKSSQAVVATSPAASPHAFLKQRIRWASKTLYYDDKKVLYALAFVYCFNMLFLILLIAGFFASFYWLLALAFWLVKTFTELPLVRASADFFQQQQYLPYFFFFQPLHMFYVVYTGIASQLGRYEWKGRRVK